MALRACVLAALLVSAQGEGLQLYSCTANVGNWEVAWTPDWQAWCCLHHAPAGCPSTSTLTSTTVTKTTTSVTTTTETVTSTSTWTWTSTTTESRDSCVMDCDFDGKVATCGDRIQWAAKHMTPNEEDPEAAARVLVSQHCGFCMECGATDYYQADTMFVKKFGLGSGSGIDFVMKRVFPSAALPAIAALMLVVGVGIAARRHAGTRRHQVTQLSIIDDDIENMDAAMLSDSENI